MSALLIFLTALEHCFLTAGIAFFDLGRLLMKNKGWLPGMDSNHDSRLQRPLSYH